MSIEVCPHGVSCTTKPNFVYEIPIYLFIFEIKRWEEVAPHSIKKVLMKAHARARTHTHIFNKTIFHSILEP